MGGGGGCRSEKTKLGYQDSRDCRGAGLEGSDQIIDLGIRGHRIKDQTHRRRGCMSKPYTHASSRVYIKDVAFNFFHFYTSFSLSSLFLTVLFLPSLMCSYIQTIFRRASSESPWFLDSGTAVTGQSIGATVPVLKIAHF